MRYVSGVISYNAMSQIFRTFEQQADLLIQRGMHSSRGLDKTQLKAQIEERLKYINYYRLSSYWSVAFSGNTPKSFHPGTYWEDVIARYMFDRRLKQIVFDAISRIEVAMRTQLAHHWAKETQSVSPQRSSNHYSPSFRVGNFLSTVDTYYKDNQSEEAIYYRKQYKDVRTLPVWIFIEFTTFGNLLKLMTMGFKSSSQIVNEVATNMGFSGDSGFFLSGIALLKDIRNTCAHQSRVWNRRWLSRKGASVLKCSQNPAWGLNWDARNKTWSNTSQGDTLITQTESTAAALTFCYQIIKTIAPHSNWKSRLIELLTDSDSSIGSIYKHLGFSNSHWMEHPLWQ